MNYLSNEIKKNDPKYFIFLIPNSRKLFDIFARLIHLLDKCPSNNYRVLTCLASQLLVLKNIENEGGFNSLIKKHDELLVLEKISFPAYSKFDYLWYRNTNNLKFSTSNKILTKEIIDKYCNHENQIFTGKDLPKIYGMFSEYLHGNPYYYLDTAHNERY